MDQLPTTHNGADAGYDSTDGQYVLAGELQVRRSKHPTPGVIKQLNPAMLTSSEAAHQHLAHHRDTRDGQGANTPLRKKKQKKQSFPRVFPCITLQCQYTTTNTTVIYIKNGTEKVVFGMEVRSVRENGVTRHYIDDVSEGTLANSFTLEDGDEILMLQNKVLVNEKRSRVSSLFHKLPIGAEISMITRRPLRTDKDGHVVYEYFDLNGAVEVTDEISKLEHFTSRATTGYGNDLIAVRLVSKEDRVISTVDHVRLRVKDGILQLDPNDNSSFPFMVWEYHAYDLASQEPVTVWIIQSGDDVDCSVISFQKDIILSRQRLKKNGNDFRDSGGSEIKWMTKVIADTGAKHMFKSLHDKDYFLGAKKDGHDNMTLTSVKKNSWEEAAEDDRTIFHVYPYSA